MEKEPFVNRSGVYMLDKHSFRTIRTFGGSQQGGLEELVCQLAHLNVPPNGRSFVRKEGAGGDAGVECFWILGDGAEHAWQAKYFLDELTPSRWGQIDESVKTALSKHPNITKYYVCVPMDRTDTRSTGPRGKQTISVLDEWNQHVLKWTTLATTLGMRVDFEYWGAHEMLLPLHLDAPQYSGRALYWFNAVVLTNEKLKRCIEKQEKTLGERYTPKFHVDLPIAKTLNGLTNGIQFWQEVNENALVWSKARTSFQQSDPPVDLTATFRQLTQSLDAFKRNLDSVILTRDRIRLAKLQEEVSEATSRLVEYLGVCQDSKAATTRPNRHTRSYYDEVSHFTYDGHSNLSDFLNSDFVNANIASAVLVSGDAGTGKSHLFCDFAKAFTQSRGPAVLMLGQHYRGGNPLMELLDFLDLKHYSYETVLGALDAAGEAAKVNAVVLFDAINEGPHRNEWSERIVGLLHDLKHFPHVSLAISCRSRFDDILVPSHIQQSELLRITHEGFRGHEHKAASIYLSGQGISKPTTPITAPEFSNPLFLKTCATALKQMGKTSWPKGYQGASSLFDIYLSSLETVISKKRQTESNDKLCRKALEAIGQAMFPEQLFGLPWDKAREIVNAVDTCVNPTESLFQSLLREGALAEDVTYSVDDDGSEVYEPIVRFAYERFCDHFVAQQLIRVVENPAEIFEETHPFGKTLLEKGDWQCRGILEALSIIVPEKFGLELWDTLPERLNTLRQSPESFFFRSLPFRAPSSFTARTRELFNSLQPLDYGFQDKKLDLLVQFATEPSHPWNAEGLHKFLAEMQMPERDAIWSVYVAKNDDEQDGEQPESAIRSVIDWATFADLSFVEEEQAYLSLITLTWFATTTNRKTRDQSTKAAAKLFARYDRLVVPILDKFQNIEDLYLQERLYASAYGGLCNTSGNEHLSTIAKYVFERQFRSKSPTEHILLRDYARGIVELAVMRDCLDNSISIEHCRPPYKSEWPLENPLASEVEDHGRGINHSIFSNDFGTYTMNAVHKWSPTSLENPDPQSQSEVLEILIDSLCESSRKLFRHAVAMTRAHEGGRQQYSTLEFEESEGIEQEVDDVLESDPNIDFVEGRVNEDLAGTFDEELLANIYSDAQAPDVNRPTKDDVNKAWAEFHNSLEGTNYESFRWAQGFWRNGDITATFDKEWAKRWVCKYAFGLGWTAELFEEFERSLPYKGRSRPQTERIGKKYQRIAFHKFLAHLSDNVHYKEDRDLGDPFQSPRYLGPWQPWERDIDPTHWIRNTSDSGWDEWDANVWWRPFAFSFARTSDDLKRRWCEDPSDLPRFEAYIKVSDESQKTWYSLRGFSSWHEKPLSGDESSLKRDIWFRVNSIIVASADLKSLQQELESKDFISPDVLDSISTGHQVYLREYPWHPSVSIQDRFEKDEAWGDVKSPHVIPYVEYEWERGSGDQSTEMNLSLYIPSSFLTEKMNLRADRNHFDRWIDATGTTVFLDPSVESDGPSFALMNCKAVDATLIQHDLVLVWLIGGEKMIGDESSIPVKARMIFNTMLWTNGDGEIHSSNHHYME